MFFKNSSCRAELGSIRVVRVIRVRHSLAAVYHGLCFHSDNVFLLYKDTKYSAEYDAATLDEQPNAANEMLK